MSVVCNGIAKVLCIYLFFQITAFGIVAVYCRLGRMNWNRKKDQLKVGGIKDSENNSCVKRVWDRIIFFVSG